MPADERKRETPVERYIYDYQGSMTKNVMSIRTVGNSAAFFLPYLRPGLDLLDMGCGQGTITLGLAKAVAPGKAVGVDLAQSQIRAAQKRAADEDASNARFVVGDMYHLGFGDSTFDAVFSHAVFDHLQRPIDALKEAWRVLKPGGIIGVRAADFEGLLLSPTTPVQEKARKLQIQFREYNGGDPFVGRKLRSLLRAAGFRDNRGSASCTTAGTSEEIRAYVQPVIESWTGPKIREVAIRLGWADQAYFDAVEEAIRAWGDSPDAFFTLVQCEVVGWKS